LQAVLLDLHRQLGAAHSQADLARTMGLALTGSFACERLVVLRRSRVSKQFESVAEIGDIPATLHEAAPQLAARIAPFLPHVAPLAPLLPPFSEAVQDAAQRLSALGFARAAWLHVDKQVEWLVLVGPKLSGDAYDAFDLSLLRATFDAATLACSKLLLLDKLEERNRELVAANHRLQQIDDLKTAILYGVSHELRSPLARILGYAEALRDDEVGSHDTREFLDIIVSNTHQLAARIEDSLRFAELIGGRTAPHRQQVPLHDLLRAEADAHLDAAAARGVHIVTACDPLVVLTDPHHVRLILKCLIENAVRFTPEGGQITVEARPAGAGADIRVADTGAGIPEEARDRIWRAFETGDVTLQREQPGLGLGLALATRLAAELGVQLELERTGPAGSVFVVRFPDAAAGNPAPARVHASVQRSTR
jgi:signal transduction histidine kinase